MVSITMPVEVSWYLENRIGLVKFIADVTIEEIEDATQTAITMLNRSDTPFIHTLNDASELKSMPKNVRALYQASKDGYAHPRVGWIVAYSVNNAFFKFMGNTVTQLTGVRFRITPTQTDALKWLQSRDTTLPPLLKHVTRPLPPLE